MKSALISFVLMHDWLDFADFAIESLPLHTSSSGLQLSTAGQQPWLSNFISVCVMEVSLMHCEL